MRVRALGMTIALMLIFVSVVVLVPKTVSTAGPPGSFVVASNGNDGVNGAILVYDSTTGQFKRTLFASGGTGQSQGITLGPDSAVYASLFDSLTNTNGHVIRVQPASERSGASVAPGEGGLASASALTFGPGGDLFVSDTLNREVLRFDGRTSAFVEVFISGLGVVQDLVFGPDGNLYVSFGNSDLVRRYNGATGASMGIFVAAGSGGLNGPIGMAFGTDGDLFIASAFTDSVLRFDGSTDAFVSVFASLTGLASVPTDVAFGPDENLYVVGRQAGPLSGILRFDGESGAFLDHFIEAGAGGLTVLNVGMFLVDQGCAVLTVPGAASGCFPEGFGALSVARGGPS